MDEVGVLKGLLRDGYPLSIGQAVTVTGVQAATLRYWERVFGEFFKAVRTGGNHRCYGTEEINCILTIKRLLKEDKYTMEGAKQVMRRS